MTTLIERDLEMRLVLSPEHSVRVYTGLSYRVDDPYAVHITFHKGSSTPVTWGFARELLLDGLSRPAGHGDVRIWPSRARGHEVLCLALSAPQGDALLEAPAASVSHWLAQTQLITPLGTEEWASPLDAQLTRLLTDVSGTDDATDAPETDDSEAYSSDTDASETDT